MLKFKTRLFLLIFFIFYLSSIIYHLSYAADEFDTAYDITYEIQANGSAKVVFDISLTNRLSNVYATEYHLTLEKGQISNVGAWDSLGKIQTKVEESANQTKIGLKFNDQVVGAGKTLRFTLKYEIGDIAKKRGQVWQVILPKQSGIEKLAEYRLTLKVPRDFPPLSSVLPNPTDQKITRLYQEFIFDGSKLKQGGVVAVFGQFQVFDFRLIYHLSNPKGSPVYTKVALPPATSYQRVNYFRIDPLPEDVEVDEDGNWLAIYNLLPREEKDVVAQGQAQIYNQPITKTIADDNYLAQLLDFQLFWEVEDPNIRKLAQKLKTPKPIYDFVVKTLSYDFERVKSDQGRMGAKQALVNPDQAICMEFTDLFVTLARAAGIPAREINGFAYTDNPKLKPLSQATDILHSWPEYWDFESQRWVPVDPTWQATSGLDYFNQPDLFHFAFAIHGLDSQYPPAAGSYKKEEDRQKDIKVEFGNFSGEPENMLEAKFYLPPSYLVERGLTGHVVLINLGPAAFFQLPVEISSDNISFLSQKEVVVDQLPPFGKKIIPVKIAPDWDVRKLGQKKIALLANNQQFVYNVKGQSLMLYLVVPVVLGITVSILIGLVILKKSRK